jgi:chromate transporter
MRIINLWWQFFLIGLVAFGGGTAIIPLMQRVFVDDQGWVSLPMFVDIIGLSQITPGPIAINAATFIGYQSIYLEYASIPLAIVGSTVATVGVIMMPSLLMGLVLRYEQRDSIKQRMNKILWWLRPALVGLIGVSAVSIGELSIDNALQVALFVVAFGLLLSKKIHPIGIIVIGAISGILLF